MQASTVSWLSLGPWFFRQGGPVRRFDVLCDALALEPARVLVDGAMICEIREPSSDSTPALGTGKVDGNDVVVYLRRSADLGLRSECYFNGQLLGGAEVTEVPEDRAQSSRRAARQEAETHYRGLVWFSVLEAIVVILPLAGRSIPFAIVAGGSLASLSYLFARAEIHVLAWIAASQRSTFLYGLTRAASWVGLLAAAILALALWLLLMALIAPLVL